MLHIWTAGTTIAQPRNVEYFTMCFCVSEQPSILQVEKNCESQHDFHFFSTWSMTGPPCLGSQVQQGRGVV